MKNKPFLAKREDGFTVSYAKWHDFPKFVESINDLSEESKSFYQPWMFKKNPPFKIKLAQLSARLSLIQIVRRIIKMFYPYGYAVVLKCESPDNELVGNMCMYNFRRLSGGKYMVTESKVIFDKFQNIGLIGFVTEVFIEIAKKEKVRFVRSGTRQDNIRNKKTYEKYGWRLKETIKDGHKYKGKSYDNEIWILDLEK